MKNFTKKVMAIIGLIACSTPMTIAQSSFQHTYGGNGTDNYAHVKQTSDGGYIIGGSSTSYGAGNYDFLLTKVDSTGNIQWSRAYGGSSTDIARAVIQTSDGGYLIAGYTQSFGSGSGDLYAVKTDANGNFQWDRTAGGAQFELANDVIELSTGGYIMAGYTYTYGQGGKDCYIVALDANGNFFWSKVWGGTGDEETFSLVLNADGTFSSAGVTNSYGNGSDDFYIQRFSANGSTIYSSYTYGGSSADREPAITQTLDGGWMICGNTYSWSAGLQDILMVKINSGSVVQWSRSIGGTDSDYGRKAIEMGNGDYVVGGYGASYDPILEVSPYLFRTNSTGNVQWAETYGGNQFDDVNSIDLTSDGGYVLGADAQSFNYGHYLIKTDGMGWSNGCQESFIPTETVASATLYNPTPFEEYFTFGGISTNPPTITNTPALLSEDPVVYASIIGTDVLCNGQTNGSADLTVTGGSSSYTYAWSNSQSVQDIFGLMANTYTVTVSDANGCEVVEQVTINQPSVLSSSTVITDVNCNAGNDGAVDLTPTGGVAPYTFFWSNAQSTEDINGLTAGTYLVTITDANGCTSNNAVGVTEPTVLTSSVIGADASCNGTMDGTADLTPAGGTIPYSYSWSNSSTNEDPTGLGAGSYDVTVTDGNGCTVLDNVVIAEPTAINIVTSVIAANCGIGNGQGTVSASGGIGSFTYNWSSGGTASVETGLVAGSYAVTATDSTGCTAEDSLSIDTEAPTQDICLITVDSTSTRNIVVWEKPVMSGLDSFRVYRDIIGTYTQVASIAYDELSEFTDSTNGINPNTTSYRYLITSIDSCGNESDTVAFHETIHLASNIGTGNDINLSWDNYEGFSFTFYYILRDTVGNGSYQIIDSVGTTNTQYTDIGGQLFSYADYMIEVVPPASCTSSRAQNYNSARSNRSSAASTGIGLAGSVASLLNVYPNPATKTCTVTVELHENETVKMQLFNAIGALVLQEEQQYPMGRQNHVLYIDDLRSGVYFLKVQVGGQVHDQKLVINR